MAWSVHDLDAGSDTIDGDDLAVFERLATDAIALVERANLDAGELTEALGTCLLYTSPSPRDATLSRMPSSA